MRIDIGYTGLLASTTDNMYERGQRWSDLSFRRKIATIKGQVHYKSIYPVIALGYVSGNALLAGLALIAVYKHIAWVRLISRTLAAARTARPDRTAIEPTAPAPHTIQEV
jgi:hypothetical protein